MAVGLEAAAEKGEKVRAWNGTQETTLAEFPERAPRITGHVREEARLRAGEHVRHMAVLLYRGAKLLLGSLAMVGDELLEFVNDHRDRSGRFRSKRVDAIEHLAQGRELRSAFCRAKGHREFLLADIVLHLGAQRAEYAAQGVADAVERACEFARSTRQERLREQRGGLVRFGVVAQHGRPADRHPVLDGAED